MFVFVLTEKCITFVSIRVCEGGGLDGPWKPR